MNRHMSVYEPYRTDGTHEDNLTRAFLIVVRAVPLAHATWLSLVRAGHREADRIPRDGDARVPELHELGEVEVDTQHSGPIGGVNRVVSVLMTDEEFFLERVLVRSTREQRLDGVVRYGRELALVVENKLAHQQVWEQQLEVTLDDDVEHDPRLACVLWRDLIRAWLKLLQAGVFSPSEAVLVGDFVDFGERYFSRLQPYATVAMCGVDEFRLRRRCHRLLECVGMGEVKKASGWGSFIELPSIAKNVAVRVALIPCRAADEVELRVTIAPADKVGQAQEFHRRMTVDDLARLASAGWHVAPHFHFSFMQVQPFVGHGRLSAAEYFEYWQRNVSKIGRVRRDDWEATWEELSRAGIVKAADRADFDAAFTNTARQFAIAVPGYYMEYAIPQSEAAKLDDGDEGQLVTRVREIVREAGRLMDLTFATS